MQGGAGAGETGEAARASAVDSQIMGQLNVSLSDDALGELQKDYDSFVRTSTMLDARFTPPTFDDFVRARILDSPLPLTEKAVAALLNTGQYAWAKRTFEKEVPDLVGTLFRDAREFGFGVVVRSEWNSLDVSRAARGLAERVVEGCQCDPAAIDTLTDQIAGATFDVKVFEQLAQTPAWRVASSLRQRAHEARAALEASSGPPAREHLGALRLLLTLGIVYGSIARREAEQMLENLRIARPELFATQQDDLLTRIAAFIRALLGLAPSRNAS